MENLKEIINSKEINADFSEVKVGEMYPLAGAITNILSINEDYVEVEINFEIQGRMWISVNTEVETIKRKAFEPAMFIGIITNKDNGTIKFDCETVIFGEDNSIAA